MYTQVKTEIEFHFKEKEMRTSGQTNELLVEKCFKTSWSSKVIKNSVQAIFNFLLFYQSLYKSNCPVKIIV